MRSRLASSMNIFSLSSLFITITFCYADYDSSVLPSIVSQSLCDLASDSVPLKQVQTLFAADILTHNSTSSSSSSNSTSDATIRGFMYAMIRSSTSFKRIFTGFDDGLFLGWLQNGTVPIPTNYNGASNVGPYIWTYGGKTLDSCNDFGINNHCLKFYYSYENSPIIFNSYYYATSFDAFNQHFFQQGLNASHWTGAEIDTSDSENLIVSLGLTLVNSFNDKVGFVAANISMSSFQTTIEESSLNRLNTDDDNNTRVYVFEQDNNNNCKLLASSSSLSNSQTSSLLNMDDVDDDIIKNSFNFLFNNHLDHTNNEFSEEVLIYNDQFIQCENINSIADIEFRQNKKWIFVYVQPISCLEGWSLNNITNKCELCEYPTTSYGGNTECNLCIEDYYLKSSTNDHTCMECPNHALCIGDSYYPQPIENYWMDRSKNKYNHKIYKCEMNTCIGYNEVKDKEICWTSDLYTVENINCTSDELQCSEGSFGPLCGSCKDGYTQYDRTCILCDKMSSWIPIIMLSIFFIIVLFILSISSFQNDFLKNTQSQTNDFKENKENEDMHPSTFVISQYFSRSYIYYKLNIVYNKIIKYPPFNMIKDRGMLKVVWSTLQIISTIGWNLSVKFPAPFSSFINILSFFQLDVISLDCLFASDFLDRVVFVSITPIVLSMINILIGFIRFQNLVKRMDEKKTSPTHQLSDKTLPLEVSHDNSSKGQKNSGECLIDVNQEYISERKEAIITNHATILLLLSYIVLPVAVKAQFAALECVDLHGEFSFLRIDTSINCHSTSYRKFVILNIFFILLYQFIPITWLILLYRCKNKLIQFDIDIDINDDDYNHKINLKERKKMNLENKRRQRMSNKCSKNIMYASLESDDHDEDVNEDVNKEKESAKLNHVFSQNIWLPRLKFLWQDYLPTRWWYEILETYRRIFFVAALPLIGQSGNVRCSIGVVASILFLIVGRELSPFKQEATNVLYNMSHYQILFTFFGALTISTNALSSLKLSNLLLGILLLIINLILILLACIITSSKYKEDVKRRRWRRCAMNKDEIDLLKQVFGFIESDPSTQEVEKIREDGDIEEALIKTNHDHQLPSTNDKNEIELMSTLNSTDNKIITKRKRSSADITKALLKKYLIKSKDVELKSKIGAGSFGEVFKGTCLGQPVAIKTMINVNKKNVLAFRDEIILTAQLRHPNIVNFIGACWGEELTCLVLEWVSKGCLSDLLFDDENSTNDVSEENDVNDINKPATPSSSSSCLGLSWEDPLLKLATDIARGMLYLHQCEYHCQKSNENLKCILHRDLKPENVLVSEFAGGKLTDFGTSRAKEVNDTVTMTAVGTPLYCAPEIAKGEIYNEKADVYSFGLLLLAMCVNCSLIDFIAERWRIYTNKSKPTKQPMRFIRAMTEKGWRPCLEYNDPQSAPFSISHLIHQCCLEDFKLRPSFETILYILENEVVEEVYQKTFSNSNSDSDTAAGARRFVRVPWDEPAPPKIPSEDAKDVLNKVSPATSSSEQTEGTSI